MTKLRASNLRIPIETGRWYNIPKDERVCILCGQSIGDEFSVKIWLRYVLSQYPT
jgi:hypothetical protein